jgi:P27 family predicted phage terminase small subunit
LGQLSFHDGAADAVKLLLEWRVKHDPSRSDKIGPAILQIIEQRGLIIPSEGKSKKKLEPPVAVAAGEPAADASGPPAHLSIEMRRFWKRVTGEYDLESDARLILKTACEAYDRAAQARQLISTDGILLGMRRHPAIDVEAQSQGLFLRAMRQLGLDIEPSGPVGRPAGKRGG